MSKRVIAALDIPPVRAKLRVRDSFEAAADRWGATMHWIEEPLGSSHHPFWQKLIVWEEAVKHHGHCHLLQLDSDMLIREDCPSIFDLVEPSQFGLISSRQRWQGWFERNPAPSTDHKIWASRTGTQAAPHWSHPNGGLYIYGTQEFEGLLSRAFESVSRHPVDHGYDESLIINELWQNRRDKIKYLPARFNTMMNHYGSLKHRKGMSTYIYHFLMKNKKFIPNVSWRYADEFNSSGKEAQTIVSFLRGAGIEPKAGAEVGVYNGDLAADLLSLLPELTLYGVDSWSAFPGNLEKPDADHIQLRSQTGILPECISIAQQQIAANNDRWHPIRLDSEKASRCFDDGQLDFAYVDADHRYEAVVQDLQAWWPKVRPGGLLMGHDYSRNGFPGVVRAVDEFARSRGLKVEIRNRNIWKIDR